MKKALILSLIAFSSAVANAQVSVKDSIAAAKAAAKAAKAKQAQELKEFKAKQAQELKEFIETQKNGKVVTISVPDLVTPDDSVAYIYGIATSRGLKQHVLNNLKVDSTYLNLFAEGVLNRVNTDDSDQKTHAINSGWEIGNQLCQMVARFSKDYYDEDGKLIDRKIMANAMLESLFEGADITPEDAGNKLNEVMTKRKAELNEKKYGELKRAGEKFLAENKTKDGVVTLPSGLQYKVLVKGDEKSARAGRNDNVKVNYEGRLIDGTVFDSSYKRGEPNTFRPSQVIKGWTEALTMMPVGAKWELYIPYNLGYGENGAGNNIKPFSALIFTVELLEITK